MLEPAAEELDIKKEITHAPRSDTTSSSCTCTCEDPLKLGEFHVKTEDVLTEGYFESNEDLHEETRPLKGGNNVNATNFNVVLIKNELENCTQFLCDFGGIPEGDSLHSAGQNHQSRTSFAHLETSGRADKSRFSEGVTGSHLEYNPVEGGLCDFSPNPRRNLILNVHEQPKESEKPFKCDLCDYSSVRRGDLKRHMRSHTGEKPFKCELCDYSSSGSGGLTVHRRSHTGEKPFKCEVCAFSFRNSSDLKRHKRSHTREKPFRCELCDFRFGRRDHLKVHMRLHTGEKPFKCERCNYRCRQRGNLKAHMQSHTGGQSFKCEMCHECFNQLSSLKAHKRSHIGQNPFKCELCTYSFINLGYLQRHMRSHIRE